VNNVKYRGNSASNSHFKKHDKLRVWERAS
jgi:hypothetical protein